MKKALLDGALIDLTKLTKPEMVNMNRNQRFMCEKCRQPVVFKHGTRKQAHFAHMKAGIGETQPESVAHKLVKEVVARWLRHQGIQATVEHNFPKINRIADVYFKYQNEGYVFEIQKSPMSETEFRKRILDYRRVGIKIIWIFLGELKRQDNTYRLPPVMQARSVDKLIHFCTASANVTIFENPVYVSTKEIYGQAIYKRLRSLDVQDVLKKPRIHMYVNKQWLDIKWHFRKQGWFFVSKSERKLVEQCLMRGFNLAQLPSEVGWPVPGNGINKHLFVWQTYVIVGIMKFFHIGGFFGAHDIKVILQREYNVKCKEGAHMQIKQYLMWLVMFEILERVDNYFEYVNKPGLNTNMEACLKRDELLVGRGVSSMW